MSDKQRLIYILLALFTGAWGVHNFYLGDNKKGIIQLILTLLVITSFITFIWVLVDIITVDKDTEGRALV